MGYHIKCQVPLVPRIVAFRVSLMFGFTVQNIKENQIQSKFLEILYCFKFLSLYIIEKTNKMG